MFLSHEKEKRAAGSNACFTAPIYCSYHGFGVAVWVAKEEVVAHAEVIDSLCEHGRSSK